MFRRHLLARKRRSDHTAAEGTAAAVTATRGFEYRAATESFELESQSTTCSIQLKRWIDLAAEGWQVADEHVHYERTDLKWMSTRKLITWAAAIHQRVLLDS